MDKIAWSQSVPYIRILLYHLSEVTDFGIKLIIN